MKLMELLTAEAAGIVEDALTALQRAHVKGYEKAGAAVTRERLARLYELTVESVERRNLTALARHAEDVARARRAAGYDLREVQTAFNVLEEVIWKRILAKVDPAEVAEALGLVSTVLGAGKDRLACAYLGQAAGAGAPSLDQRALFSGTDGA
ncbi:MAG: hypothetical protein HY812_11100 [Planctomycetes bacterium]|nr:hypothetical protein [Planctomycetota bacterium]